MSKVPSRLLPPLEPLVVAGLGALAIMAVGSSINAASAAGGCGAIVTEANAGDDFGGLQDCSGTALTIVGPAQVDLGGATVSCDGSFDSVGINIIGEGAGLRDGTVEGCAIGLLVEGDGDHRIRRIAASGNGQPNAESGGIDVRSNGNRLTRVSATDNGLFGIRVDGSDNRIKRCNASDNGWFGILILGEHNTVMNCRANRNEDSNIAVVDDLGSSAAVQAGGDANRIIGNEANESRSNDGIYVSGDTNLVRDNVASNNFTDGIDVDLSGSENLITGNTAFDNHAATDTEEEDYVGRDLKDATTDCDANAWERNNFETSRAAAVESPSCIR